MEERHRHRWTTRVTPARLLAAAWMMVVCLLAGVGPVGGPMAGRDPVATLAMASLCGHPDSGDSGDAPDRSDTCGACCVFATGGLVAANPWLAPAALAPSAPRLLLVRQGPLPDPATLPTARGPPSHLI